MIYNIMLVPPCEPLVSILLVSTLFCVCVCACACACACTLTAYRYDPYSKVLTSSVSPSIVSTLLFPSHLSPSPCYCVCACALTAYRYDPYSKVLTSEAYDTTTMKSIRWKAIQSARHAKVQHTLLIY